jgi:hypothetical protein
MTTRKPRKMVEHAPIVTVAPTMVKYLGSKRGLADLLAAYLKWHDAGVAPPEGYKSDENVQLPRVVVEAVYRQMAPKVAGIREVNKDRAVPPAIKERWCQMAEAKRRDWRRKWGNRKRPDTAIAKEIAEADNGGWSVRSIRKAIAKQ